MAGVIIGSAFTDVTYAALVQKMFAGVVAKDAAGGRSTSYSLVMAARPFSAADIVKRAKALGVTSTEATQMIRRSRDVRNRKR